MDIAAAHRTGIGGSDIAAVLGMVDGTDAVDVWMQIKGGKKRNPIDEESSARGHGLEAWCLERYATANVPHHVVRPGKQYRHPEMPYLLGHTDGTVCAFYCGWTGDPACEAGTCSHVLGGVDGKTESAWADSRAPEDRYGREGTDQVPARTYAQCQQYMLLAEACEGVDIDWWDVARLSGWDMGVHVYRVRRDPVFCDRIVEAATALWWYVETDTPPPSDRTDVQAWRMDMDRTVTVDDRLIINAGDPAEPITARLVDAKRVKDVATSEYDAACLGVRELMGEAEKLKAPDLTVSWRAPRAGAKRTFRPKVKKEKRSD